MGRDRLELIGTFNRRKLMSRKPTRLEKQTWKDDLAVRDRVTKGLSARRFLRKLSTPALMRLASFNYVDAVLGRRREHVITILIAEEYTKGEDWENQLASRYSRVKLHRMGIHSIPLYD